MDGSKKKIVPSSLFSIRPGDTITPISKKEVASLFNITFKNNRKLIKDLGKY